MLNPGTSRCFVAVEPVDLRLGLDGLYARIQPGLVLNPVGGDAAIYRNSGFFNIIVIECGRYESETCSQQVSASDEALLCLRQPRPSPLNSSSDIKAVT